MLEFLNIFVPNSHEILFPLHISTKATKGCIPSRECHSLIHSNPLKLLDFWSALSYNNYYSCFICLKSMSIGNFNLHYIGLKLSIGYNYNNIISTRCSLESVYNMMNKHSSFVLGSVTCIHTINTASVSICASRQSTYS